MAIRIKPKTIILIAALLLINFFIFLFFYTCVHNTNECQDFGQVSFIDAATVDGKEYNLMMRQTGFQDKVQFLLLYPHSVSFDSCGEPIGDEIANEMIDDFAGKNDVVQCPEKIEIKDNKIVIHYTKKEDKYKPLVDVPVIWHQN